MTSLCTDLKVGDRKTFQPISCSLRACRFTGIFVCVCCRDRVLVVGVWNRGGGRQGCRIMGSDCALKTRSV